MSEEIISTAIYPRVSDDKKNKEGEIFQIENADQLDVNRLRRQSKFGGVGLR